MFPGSRAEVKARAHRGRVPAVDNWSATEFATPGCRPAAARFVDRAAASGMRRSCSPSRVPRRSRRWPCRTRRPRSPRTTMTAPNVCQPDSVRCFCSIVVVTAGGGVASASAAATSARTTSRSTAGSLAVIDGAWPARVRPRSSPAPCGRRARRLARSMISIERSSESEFLSVSCFGLRVVVDQLAVPVEPAAVVDGQAVELRRRQGAKLLRPLGCSRALRRHDARLVHADLGIWIRAHCPSLPTLPNRA